MAKCICCGGSCLTRGRIKLMDADICFKCFDALGFDHKLEFYVARNLYKWDEIKVGKSAYLKNKEAAHEKWLQDNPDVVEFINVLDEYGEESPASEDSSTADEDEFDN